MTPWKLVDCLASGDQSDILSKLKPDDPFWVGASYAVDPFVGIIIHLPMRDPYQYGTGLKPKIFDKFVKGVLDRDLSGDSLVLAIEQISKHCTEEEWTLWYRRILEGDMNLRLPLAIFNKYCPDEYRIPPPALNKPKPINAISDLPRRFFVQPVYPDERVFWLINSTSNPIEIRCYDDQIRSVRNSEAEASLIDFAKSHSVDILLSGFLFKKTFLAEDILTREQFTQENSIFPLHKRLAVLIKLGLPMVQMSGLFVPQNKNAFFNELNLIFEQGFNGVVIRDLDAYYPFRTQPDILIKPTVKGVVTCTEVVPNIGLKATSMRGSKEISSFVRLGLTASIFKDILSNTPIGRRLEVLSCGQKDDILLLPIFQQWRS